MDTPVVLAGVDAFKASPPIVVGYDVVLGEEHVLHMTSNVTMTNPSPVGFANLGTLVLDVLYDGVIVGSATSHNTSLLPRTTSILMCHIALTRTKDNAAAISSALSKVINQEPLSLSLHGTKSSTTIAVLKDALQYMQATAQLNPLDSVPVLMRSAYGVIPHAYDDLVKVSKPKKCNTTGLLPELSSLVSTAYITVVNPFSVDLTLNEVSLGATWMGNPECFTSATNATTGVTTKTFLGPEEFLISSQLTWNADVHNSSSQAEDFDFKVPAKSDGLVFADELCLAQAQVKQGMTNFNVCFSTLYNNGTGWDSTGATPFPVDLVVHGSATAAIGDFKLDKQAPLVMKHKLPTSLRLPCTVNATAHPAILC